MQHIVCSGSPYEVGYTHGREAREAVARSIAFYEKFFLNRTKRSWTEVLDTTKAFEENIQRQWPYFHAEMQGVADGAGRDLLDIVALNVRTEIVFGLMDDGCTSLYAKGPDNVALLGQNWDWQRAQKTQLVHLTIKCSTSSYNIEPPSTLSFVTEAGLIGKIGLSSAGTGVCFNAISLRGISPNKLPAHLALRMALEAPSAAAAADRIESLGVASACYILVGDEKIAIGMECTSSTIKRQPIEHFSGKSINEAIWHTNHLVLEHGPHASHNPLWKDSFPRYSRAKQLLSALESDTDAVKSSFAKAFEDEEGFPASICRKVADGVTDSETLFNIVMNLRDKTAKVKVGRPTEIEESFEIDFDDSLKNGHVHQNGLSSTNGN